MMQMEFNFETERNNRRDNVVAFPMARHTYVRTIADKLRKFETTDDLNAFWREHRREMIRRRMATGLNRQAARRDFEQYASAVRFLWQAGFRMPSHPTGESQLANS